MEIPPAIFQSNVSDQGTNEPDKKADIIILLPAIFKYKSPIHHDFGVPI